MEKQTCNNRSGDTLHRSPARRAPRFLRLLALAAALLIALFSSGCGSLTGGPDRDWKLMLDSARNTEISIAVSHSNPDYAPWLSKQLAEVLGSHDIRVKVVAIDLPKVIAQLENEKANAAERGLYDLIVFEGDGYGEMRRKELLYGPFADRLYRIDLIDASSPANRYRDAAENGGYYVPVGRRMLTLMYSEDVFYEPPHSYDELFDTMSGLKGKAAYSDPLGTEEGEAFLLGFIAQAFDMEPYLGPQRDLEAFRAQVRSAVEKLAAVRPGLLAGGTVYPTRIEDLFVEGRVFLSMSMDAARVVKKLKAYEYPETTETFVLPYVGTYTSVAAIPHSSVNKSGAMVVISAMLSPEMQASKLAIGDMTIYYGGTPVDAIEPLQKVRTHRSMVKFGDYLDCVAPDFDRELRRIALEEWSAVILGE